MAVKILNLKRIRVASGVYDLMLHGKYAGTIIKQATGYWCGDLHAPRCTSALPTKLYEGVSCKAVWEDMRLALNAEVCDG